MIDSSNADGRSDEEIVKSALAQTSPKPLLPNSMVLVVSGEKLSVSFNVAAGTNMQRFGRSGNTDGFWTSNPEVAIDVGLNAGALQTST
jgi:hypothetical protein